MKIIQNWGRWASTCNPGHNPIGRNSTLFIHYSASDGSGIDKSGEPRQAVRNVQAAHQARGWCDIGYSYIVVQPRGIFKKPLIFTGRGFNKIPASQEGYNTGNASICVIADSNDRIKRRTVYALEWLVRRCPARTVQGHRDVNATACPGDKLYHYVPRLNSVAKQSKLGRLP